MTGSLTTERLILRRWHEADREPFQALNADSRVMEFMPGVLPPEGSDAVFERIQRHFERHGFGLWATELREDREFLGFIGLAVPPFDAPFMPAVEIGWRLRSQYWGRGLATEGAREAMRFAFEILALNSIVSMTVPANLRSRRVMEKLRMTRDPLDDFDHPLLPEGHPLRRHVLYRIGRSAWAAARSN
jgi:RimJ/RimL family protein N-acetyltransferase